MYHRCDGRLVQRVPLTLSLSGGMTKLWAKCAIDKSAYLHRAKEVNITKA